MRMGFLGSVALLVLSAGLAAADSDPLPVTPIPVTPPVPAAEAKPRPEPPGMAKPAPSQMKAAEAKAEESEEPPSTIPLEPKPVPPKEACECIPPDRPWRGDRMEYLLWWMKGSRVPPLVTGAASGALPVLGPLGTSLLFGDAGLDNPEHSGARFTIGVPLDQDQSLGLEATYLFLGTRTANFIAGGGDGSGMTVLGRPYLDVTTGQEAAQVVGSPGQPGSIWIANSGRVQGAELNGVGELKRTPEFQLDLLAGFRYFEVDEGISMRSRTVVPSLNSPLPSLLGVADQFDGHNRFYGGQLGLRADFHREGYFVSLMGKVAFGEIYEVVNIAGLTTVTPAGGLPVAQTGGLLALASNSGRVAHPAFAVLPEAGVRVGWDLCDSTRMYLGYTFLYVSSVARPADQIDRGVNPALFPLNQTAGAPSGPARPRMLLRDSDFWVQGLSIGVEYRY